MKWIWYCLVVMLLAACTILGVVDSSSSATVYDDDSLGTPPPEPVRADLDDFGPAPEWRNEVWLNTERPLHLQDLRGKVVLLEMWTFG
jgi:hypothetical protein